MNRYRISALFMMLAATVLLAGCWGSSKSTSLGLTGAPQPGLVGSAVCINCHTTTLATDPSGQLIVARWQSTTHTTVQGVECEACHGGGQDHWGVGPIPFPIPGGPQCQRCHGKSGFDNTAHANLHLASGPFGPDKFFFQGDAGTGQANNRGALEFRPDNVTPVTKAQHIEQCSVCHNPNQPFVYNAGGVLGKPDPNNMPNPAPSCAGCHDAHHTQELTTIPQRTTAAGVPAKVGIQVFRPYLLDNVTGAQTDCAALGAYVRGALYQPNGAVTSTGAVNLANVSGTNNELNFERLCEACHTAGKYKYAQTTTHQSNVYPQWLLSGHADRQAPAFGEFAANPAAYGPAPGFPVGAGSHQSLYPYDIGIGSTTGGAGAIAATADNTHNAAVAGSSAGSFNDNYQCYKCHSGIGATAYMSDSQGKPGAELIFGDEPIMCYTCHSPHSQPTGTQFNLRVPRVMSKYTGNTPSNKSPRVPFSFSGNVFFDNTPVPGVAVSSNATVCIFCHQGRESGFTLYKSRLFDNLYVDNNSFQNPHYLGTGAMLWAKNGYEFIGAGFDNAYGFNAAHQGANCTTCHMDNATTPAANGGHTWKPNVASCNATGCHGAAGIAPAIAVDNADPLAPFLPLVDSYRATFDNNNYTGDVGGNTVSIAASIQTLAQKLILLLASQATPIYYDDIAYPYFFTTQDPATHTNANAFKAWTPATLKAAFNLQYVIKGLPSAGAGTSVVYLIGGAAPASVNDVGLPNTSSVLAPNASAAVHNHKYTIQLLQDSYFAVAGARITGAFRPSTNRAATVYGANQ
ncbi:MAG TPA: multiheme c-type cytochrome [Candidatus Deferrimicrobiaceae bacterium]